MRFPIHKILWRLLWIAPAYLFRVGFCLTVGLMHWDTKTVEEAWKDTE